MLAIIRTNFSGLKSLILKIHGQRFRIYEIAMKKVAINLDAVAVMAAVLIITFG